MVRHILPRLLGELVRPPLSDGARTHNAVHTARPVVGCVDGHVVHAHNLVAEAERYVDELVDVRIVVLLPGAAEEDLKLVFVGLEELRDGEGAGLAWVVDVAGKGHTVVVVGL